MPRAISGASASVASEAQVVAYGADSGFSETTAAIAAGELMVAGTTDLPICCRWMGFPALLC